MDDYVQSMNEYFSLMKKAGFDEYTHEARELFDNSLAQIDRDAAITLMELRKEAEALKVENARLRDEEPTDDKNLFECFLFNDAKTSSNFVEGIISLKRLSPDAKMPTREPC